MFSVLRSGDGERARVVRPMSCVLLAVAAAMGVLMGAASAGANSDSKRVFLPSAPYDIPANVCGFVVHVDFPVNREYGTFSEAPDGSTIVKVTGSLVETFTNVTNGNSITVNASGPGTITFLAAPSTLVTFDVEGLATFWVTNGAQFGLPNLMYTSGSFTWTTDLSNDTIVSVTNYPHVLLDVCAAIA